MSSLSLERPPGAACMPAPCSSPVGQGDAHLPPGPLVGLQLRPSSKRLLGDWVWGLGSCCCHHSHTEHRAQAGPWRPEQVLVLHPGAAWGSDSGAPRWDIRGGGVLSASSFGFVASPFPLSPVWPLYVHMCLDGTCSSLSWVAQCHLFLGAFLD